MRSHGWRGALLIAATYVYFLIFAQFGFLARLIELGVAGGALKSVMAAMAAGGIAFSLITARLTARFSPGLQLRVGFALCGTAAAIALAPLGPWVAGAIAFAIGAGLGMVTVALVTHLRVFAGTHNPMLPIGVGTGVGYFVCNIPSIFAATPEFQALFAVFVCMGAVAIPFARTGSSSEIGDQRLPRFGFLQLLASFAALVWLDSAAFYIIQHTSSLKAGTWMGDAHLWTNGCIHLLGAIAAAVLLSRHRLALVLFCAVFALGFSCILLLHPGLTLPASLFYPAGVSFYSVALVAYPSLLSGAHTAQQRAQQAGWLYAVAGWIGSALGIGMGQNLGYVPPAFVAVAGVVVLAPMLLRIVHCYLREAVAIGAVALIALICSRLLPADPSSIAQSAVERGRQVYISEGCISCHSQYVRPGTAAELMWGPTQSMEQIHAQQPPLVGNRRQGPDLAQVGSRRSPLWLKAHLIDPAALGFHSPMPSYAFLFRDTRGADLVAYLASLREQNTEQHMAQEHAWQPSVEAMQEASNVEGATIYTQECATCHDRDGAARTQWQNEFRKLPPDPPALRSELRESTEVRVAQIIKFGIPNTDMPGHEYLSGRQVASLTLWLLRRSAQPLPHS